MEREGLNVMVLLKCPALPQQPAADVHLVR